MGPATKRTKWKQPWTPCFVVLVSAVVLDLVVQGDVLDLAVVVARRLLLVAVVVIVVVVVIARQQLVERRATRTVRSICLWRSREPVNTVRSSKVLCPRSA